MNLQQFYARYSTVAKTIYFPMTVSGLSAGYDITQNSSSTNQNDLSGNGYNLTGTSTYSATGLNGKPCLTFNGTSDIMKSSTFIPSVSVYSWFIAYKLITNTGNTKSAFVNGNATNGFAYRINANRNVLQCGVGAMSDGAISGGVQEVLGCVSNGTTANNMYINSTTATSVGTTACTTATGGAITIGNRLDAVNANLTEWCNFSLGELLIYNRVLNTTEINSIMNYLKTKWGL
jgi:hypothetical protein